MNRFEDFKKNYEFDITTDHLGDGSSGNVFKAYDLEKDKYVALKIVYYKNSEINKHSLVKEVEIAKSIPDKTNIAVYDDCFRLRSDAGIIDVALMQFYEKGNLKMYLRMNDVSAENRINLVEGIINGLDQIHKGRIIHRDLKPENILIAINPAGKAIPKIADFGISKKADNLNNSQFSHSQMAGTIAYSSPEQLKEDTSSLKFNTDLWSLGVIVYEILTGHNPFAKGIDEKINKDEKRRIMLRRIRIPEIPADIGDISQPWKEVIEKCIVVDPEIRIESLKQIRDIIEKYNKPEKLPEDEIFPINEKSEPVFDMPKELTVYPHPNRYKKNIRTAWVVCLVLIVAFFFWRSTIVTRKPDTDHLDTIIVVNDSASTKIPNIDSLLAIAIALQEKDSLQGAIDVFLSAQAIRNDSLVTARLESAYKKRSLLLGKYFAMLPHTETSYSCAGERMKLIRAIRALDTSEITKRVQWQTALNNCDKK